MESKNSINVMAAWGLGRMIYIQMALRAAIELKVFDIIASFGPNAQVSSAQIISKLPTNNPNACNVLERILRVLGVNSILAMSSMQYINGSTKKETTYGLTRETCCLVTDANGVSACPFVLFHSEKENVECLYMLKDSVLNPENLPVYKAYHGRTFFEDALEKPELSHAFNQTLAFIANGLIERVLETYKGFEGITELMDVGGNIGGAIKMIVSRYPEICGINLDLPHIIATAPKYPGIRHVGGDIFQSLPKAQAIFLKSILHDWNDDQCIKILSNCWAALPDNGKVIVAEFVIPEVIDTNFESACVTILDFVMLVHQDGKERTLAEFEVLAKASGFKETKDFPTGDGFHVIELIKNTAA